MLEALIVALIKIVIVAIVFGVVVWGIRFMWPQAPAVLTNGLIVIGVLICLLILITVLAGGRFSIP